MPTNLLTGLAQGSFSTKEKPAVSITGYKHECLSLHFVWYLRHYWFQLAEKNVKVKPYIVTQDYYCSVVCFLLLWTEGMEGHCQCCKTWNLIICNDNDKDHSNYKRETSYEYKGILNRSQNLLHSMLESLKWRTRFVVFWIKEPSCLLIEPLKLFTALIAHQLGHMPQNAVHLWQTCKK